MSFLVRLIESWTEGLLRIAIGIGLVWIGAVEGAGYGLFLEVVGAIFIAAGVAEIWLMEVAGHGGARRRSREGIPSPPLAGEGPVFFATPGGENKGGCGRLGPLFLEKGV